MPLGWLFTVPVCLFQKWQCVEDATGKLRLFKCKNEGGGAKNFQRGVVGRQRPISIKSQLYHQQLDGCDCDLRDLLPFNLRPSVMRPFNKKPFFSKKSECSQSSRGQQRAHVIFVRVTVPCLICNVRVRIEFFSMSVS